LDCDFIWGIADDVLRDVYVRGKYRDVILADDGDTPSGCSLEPTQQAVLDMKKRMDAAKIRPIRTACSETGRRQAFYNNSPLRCEIFGSRAKAQQLYDFEAYLDGFSPNVQEIPGTSQAPQPDPDPR